MARELIYKYLYSVPVTQPAHSRIGVPRLPQISPTQILAVAKLTYDVRYMEMCSILLPAHMPPHLAQYADKLRRRNLAGCWIQISMPGQASHVHGLVRTAWCK